MKKNCCKECGKPLPAEYAVVGLCFECVDIVENLAGEYVDNKELLVYYENVFNVDTTF